MTTNSPGDSGDSVPPVTLTKRRLGLENKVWRVWLDSIEDNRGGRVPDYVVIEPKLTGTAGFTGVGIVAVLDGKILLLKTYRHALSGYFWEAAKGFVDAGEPLDVAARRELLEETGCVCPDDKLIALGTIAQEPSTLGGRVALYAALDCKRTAETDKEEIGLGEIHAIEPAEAFRMANMSEVEDGVTLVSLLRMQALSVLDQGQR